MLLLVRVFLLTAVLASVVRTARQASSNNQSSQLLIRPEHVRIQHIDVATHPDIVIDTSTPHFSWQLAAELTDGGQPVRAIQQVGYHIRVHALVSGQLMWDSGRVQSSSSLHIRYQGMRFTSDTRYALYIQYHTATRASAWFTARFRTALFSLTDWTGQWIGSECINMNQLRTVAQLKPVPVEFASAFISGVGFYQLYIEGQLIDPSRRLDVGWTTYQQRTLYVSYDVTHELNTTTANRVGIGIVLGQGWYNQQQWAISLNPRMALAEQYGPPRALLQLNIRYADQTTDSIVSDASWLGREGEHRFDSVYMGTTMDLRATLPCWSCANFSSPVVPWLNASVLPSPVNFTAGGQFSLQPMDPIRIGPRALHVATAGRLGVPAGVRGASLTDGGVLKPIAQDMINGQVFDLGQNFAGWCKVSSLNASRSTIIQLRYAELRYSPGANGINFAGLYYENLDSIAVMDTVVLAGSGNETFEPLFTSHGFRYLLVNGYNKVTKDNVECYNAHSETTLIGNFTSSSTVLNQIQHNIVWSQLSNSMSLPMGCPQRNDRTGWLGDAGLSIDAALYNFDYVTFYLNFLTMIEDNQTPEGAVSDTVPFMTGFLPADPNWGSAYVTITWCLYEHTGDTNIIARFYAGIQAWIDFSTEGYDRTGLANMYYHFGDWAPVRKTGNSSLVSSYAFLRDVYTFVNMSELLNRTDNVRKYLEFYERLADEWHHVFYNASVNGYADGSQTANILSLSLVSVVPPTLRPTVLNALINDLNTTGYFTGGIIGVAALYPLLSNEGHHDLALRFATATSFPSYGYMFTNQIQNATTTWEQWNSLPTQARSSLNHHMFNSIGGWFYRYLAGIELHALRAVTVRPRMSFDENLLRHVDAEVVTIKGALCVMWTRISVDSVLLSVSVPNNLNATVVFDPLIRKGRCQTLICDDTLIGARDMQSGQLQSVNNVYGVSGLTEDLARGIVSVNVASGDYKFVAQWTARWKET